MISNGLSMERREIGMGENSHDNDPVNYIGEYYRESPSLGGEIVTAHS